MLEQLYTYVRVNFGNLPQLILADKLYAKR